MAMICLDALHGRPARHALDLGCATGRASFELAAGGFGKVTGLDQSARTFRLAVRMQEQGRLRYAFPEEGELVSFHEVSLTQTGLDTVRENVAFFQADACNLPEKFTGYDLVLAALLLEDLYAPRQFLETIHTRLVPGGLLVIASAWSWSEDRTKKAQWLGGYREAGEPVLGADGLELALAGRFRRVGEPRDVPFVVRQGGRMFQHGVAEVTIWELT
jgi:putative 4-mercaptohistidine N1-methyltranferase